MAACICGSPECKELQKLCKEKGDDLRFKPGESSVGGVFQVPVGDAEFRSMLEKHLPTECRVLIRYAHENNKRLRLSKGHYYTPALKIFRDYKKKPTSVIDPNRLKLSAEQVEELRPSLYTIRSGDNKGKFYIMPCCPYEEAAATVAALKPQQHPVAAQRPAAKKKAQQQQQPMPSYQQQQEAFLYGMYMAQMYNSIQHGGASAPAGDEASKKKKGKKNPPAEKAAGKANEKSS